MLIDQFCHSLSQIGWRLTRLDIYTFRLLLLVFIVLSVCSFSLLRCDDLARLDVSLREKTTRERAHIFVRVSCCPCLHVHFMSLLFFLLSLFSFSLSLCSHTHRCGTARLSLFLCNRRHWTDAWSRDEKSRIRLFPSLSVSLVSCLLVMIFLAIIGSSLETTTTSIVTETTTTTTTATISSLGVTIDSTSLEKTLIVTTGESTCVVESDQLASTEAPAAISAENDNPNNNNYWRKISWRKQTVFDVCVFSFSSVSLCLSVCLSRMSSLVKLPGVELIRMILLFRLLEFDSLSVHPRRLLLE